MFNSCLIVGTTVCSPELGSALRQSQIRAKKKKKIYIYMCVCVCVCVCVFQVSRPYLGFCPDPKHFIVQNGQSKSNMVENSAKYGSESQNIHKILE